MLLTTKLRLQIYLTGEKTLNLISSEKNVACVAIAEKRNPQTLRVAITA